jgi:hypothetical protein
VKDRNGCVSTGTAATVAAQLTAAAVVTKTLDCPGAPDAVITTITGLSYTVHCWGVHLQRRLAMPMPIRIRL